MRSYLPLLFLVCLSGCSFDLSSLEANEQVPPDFGFPLPDGGYDVAYPDVTTPQQDTGAHDAGVDSRPQDVFHIPDTGSSPDTGVDSGATDAGIPDSSSLDTGASSDAGVPDVVMTDAGPPDEDAGPDCNTVNTAMCGGECIDIRFDIENCGGCNIRCTYQCVMGVCLVP